MQEEIVKTEHEKGYKQAKIEIVKNMLKDHVDEEEIIKYTETDQDAIDNLKHMLFLRKLYDGDEMLLRAAGKLESMSLDGPLYETRVVEE